MKKLIVFVALFMSAFSIKAQMGKAEVETLIKGINFQEVKDIYLIRSRAGAGVPGWFEKFEEFDPKTVKWDFNEKSLKAEGAGYTVLIPYDKIKLIFLKKATYLTIELVD